MSDDVCPSTDTAAAAATPAASVAQAPLAIVGIGAMFPKADGLDAYWQNLQKGVDAVTDVPATHWNADDYLAADPKARDMLCSARGGFLDAVDFDPLEFGIAPNDLEATDTAQLLGLVAAKRALTDAGYGDGGKEFDRERTSVILGVTGTLGLVIPLGARLGHPLWRRALREAGVPDEVSEDVVARISDGYVDWQESSFPGLLGNVVAGRIANRLDLLGTNCVVDAACASSLSALHLAAMELQSGRADTVLTGGVDTFNDVFMYMCFSKTTALSPSGAARAFDKQADGTVLGEGVGVVVLKRLADAERDGDRVYAVLKGIGSSSDGKGNAIYAPCSDGQARALRKAYAAADVSPATVELVEAHGTGTRVGDTVEATALSEVYRASGRKGRWAALGSVKSQIGHTKAAAGIAGLIKTAMALYHKVLPPTVLVDDPIDAVTADGSPFYLPTEQRPWMARAEHPRRAALSAFGFGGSNFHAVLEEYATAKPGIDWDPDVELLPMRAQTVHDLLAQVEAWPLDLAWDEFARRAAASREKFDVLSPCRLVLVIERGRTDVVKLFENTAAMLRRNPHSRSWSTLYGAHFGQGQLLGKLAMLFPGQGSQYVGMLRDLASRFPVVQNVLEKADVAYELAAGGVVGGVTVGLHLSDRIFPYPEFNAGLREKAELLLRDTRVAQPAIGAVSLGALAVLASVFGVGSTAFAGHSYGELAALQAAGSFDAETLAHLSILRGRLMAAGEGDRGSMIAVRADRASAVQLIADGGLKLTVANHNAPEQVVLSGAGDEIERAAVLCEERGIAATQLPVAAAFHSALVASAAEPLRAALGEADVAPPGATVYANATAQPYPSDPGDADAVRDLLARQIASPVEFVQLIERMYADGVRTFVEVGPGATLTRLVGAIVGDREHVALAVDASRGKKGGMHDLAACLAQIAAAGHSVDIAHWNEGVARAPPTRRRMTIPLTGANHVKPRPQRAPLPPLLSIRREAHLPPATPTRLQTVHAAPAAPPAAPCTAPPAAASSMPAPPPETIPSGAPPRGVPTPPPRPPAAGAAASLASVREQMAALLRLQEQTASLHRRFLESQEAAQRSVEDLLDQQRALLGLPPATTRPATATAPALPIAAATSEAPPAPRTPAAPPAVAAPPPPPPPTAPPPSTAPAASAAPPDLEATLLDVVAEKTGYPADMLELSMEMDADLGIDSIKRVEILAAMQERVPGLPAVASDELGRLRTLADVIAVLSAAAPGAASAPPAAAAGSVTPPAAPALGALLLDVVAEKTGYPADMLELSMEMDADLGIDSIKRVEILAAMQERVPDLPAVASDDLGRLRTLADVVAILETGDAPAPPVAAPVVVAPPASAPQAVSAAPAAVERHVLRPFTLNGAARERVQVAPGEILVAGDAESLGAALVHAFDAAGHAARSIAVDAAADLPPTMAGLVIVASPDGGDGAFLRAALGLLRRAASPLCATHGALLATVSRLDGAFGLAELNGADPASGGLAGYAKTAAQEWPGVICKALDVPAQVLDVDAAACAVADEILLRGPLEVGLSGTERLGLRLEAQPIGAAAHAPLAAGDLLVVTGGARGVTAEVAVALADAFHPALLLLGRSPLPDDEPAWLAELDTEPQIKRALSTRMNGGGSLRAVEEEYRLIAAARAIRETLARCVAAGAAATYRSVDVRDRDAVATAVHAARDAHGPVRGIVHGAGVLRDALIAEKTPEQFDDVYGTKVDGLHALLAAAQDDDLRVLVLFSSSTGRFGRAGQVDYAASNEVLNKIAQREMRARPGCRVVSVNWGPWDGGMVTDAHKRVFAEEGIGLIGLRAGADYLVQELSAGADGPVEVVVLGSGSRAPSAPQAPASAPAAALPVVFERLVSADTHPVLRSHVLDGRPVVPVVLMLQWLTHGALHANPGLRFHGIDDFRMLRGVPLHDGVATVRMHAATVVRTDGVFRVAGELRGRDERGRERLLARADVVLVERLPQTDDVVAFRPDDAPCPADRAEIYDRQLFHGPGLQGIRSVPHLSAEGVVVLSDTAPAPAVWVREPLRGSWLGDPLAIDVAFQALVVWTRAHCGAPSLPTAFTSYRQYVAAFPRDGVRIAARVTSASEHAAHADIDFAGADGRLVARMSGYECVVDASLEGAYRNRTLVGAARS